MYVAQEDIHNAWAQSITTFDTDEEIGVDYVENFLYYRIALDQSFKAEKDFGIHKGNFLHSIQRINMFTKLLVTLLNV